MASPKKLDITIYQRWLPARRQMPAPVSVGAQLLTELGHRVTEVEDGPLSRTDGVAWVVGNPNWFPVLGSDLMSTPCEQRPLVLFRHMEPLPPPKAATLPRPRLHLREIAKIILRDSRASDVYSNYFRLRRLAKRELPDLLIVFSLGRYEFLAERGIDSHWVPHGLHPSQGDDLGLERDIDVLFLGTLDVPRRKKLVQILRRDGINLVAEGSWSDPAYWGENRTRLLNRAKIYLNLLRHPGETSYLRLIIGAANKALVVSEPMYKPAPFIAGTHYVSTAIEEMAGVIRSYLDDKSRRDKIVNQAYEFVHAEVTLGRSISRILELINDRLEQRECAR